MKNTFLDDTRDPSKTLEVKCWRDLKRGVGKIVCMCFLNIIYDYRYSNYLKCPLLKKEKEHVVKNFSR